MLSNPILTWSGQGAGETATLGLPQYGQSDWRAIIESKIEVSRRLELYLKSDPQICIYGWPTNIILLLESTNRSEKTIMVEILHDSQTSNDPSELHWFPLLLCASSCFGWIFEFQ